MPQMNNPLSESESKELTRLLVISIGGLLTHQITKFFKNLNKSKTFTKEEIDARVEELRKEGKSE